MKFRIGVRGRGGVRSKISSRLRGGGGGNNSEFGGRGWGLEVRLELNNTNSVYWGRGGGEVLGIQNSGKWGSLQKIAGVQNCWMVVLGILILGAKISFDPFLKMVRGGRENRERQLGPRYSESVCVWGGGGGWGVGGGGVY